MLGESGFLSKHQKKLERLSLVTDYSCDWGGGTYYLGGLVDLTPFRNLRYLSWKSVRWITGVESLREYLRVAVALEELTLDFSDSDVAGYWRYNHMKDQDGSLEIMLNYIPELDFGFLDANFPRLTTLTLRGAPVGRSETDSIPGASGLRRLTLQNCTGVGQLLDSIIKSKQKINLTFFELMQDNWLDTSFETESLSLHLVSFLIAFKGLARLHLLLCAGEQWESIFNGIIHHRSSLKH